MRKSDLVCLHHMLDAAREALEFTCGCTRHDLNTNRKLVLALVKEIEIIGEAAARVSLAVRSQASGIPWEDVAGIRHRPVIPYASLNLDVLWRTVQDELPPLIAELECIVHPRNNRGSC